MIASSLVLLGLLAATPADAARDVLAESLLAKKRYRLAAQQYKKGLEQRPDDLDLKLGLALSWAGLGWCERAVPALEPLRPTEVWSADAALALGQCQGDLWNRSAAIEALEEAALMTADGTGTQVRLAWEALGAGDDALFDSTVDLVLDEAPGTRAALLLRGARAWRDGDWPEMERSLDELRRIQPRAPQADLLEAWSWLELGQPDEAAALLKGRRRLHRQQLPEVATWLMEANRRMGRTAIVQRMLEVQIREQEVPPSRVALRLRARADLHGVDTVRSEADALLAAHPLEPEAVATAWYAASLRGDAAAAADLAGRYDLLVPPGRRPLHVLVPAHVGDDDGADEPSESP